MLRIGTIVVAAASLMSLATVAEGVAAAAAARSARACFQPYPETEEQRIRREFGSAAAVFSGEVRKLTVEQATLSVITVWKGKLGSEVVLPTGTAEIGNGILKVAGESFNFSNGEKYVIFARGASDESLVTSACVPNVKLAEARRTIAVLDKIVKSGR